MKTIFILLITIFVMLITQQVHGSRTLQGEEWMKKNKNVIIQSLPRGPVQTPHSNPCTYIPGGSNRGRCTLAKTKTTTTEHYHNKGIKKQEEMEATKFEAKKNSDQKQ
ncbi:hypothetical protein LIER_17233 [Lithospermum erythrorhizon]|uniref:Uncharacterized protein n=1 Tax=Lithospermum erythrorhizon TaxID=34254 RepID=A0AAV3Q9S2_LITER